MLLQRLPRLLSCSVYDVVVVRHTHVPSLLPVMLRSCIFHLSRISSLAATPHLPNTCALSPMIDKHLSFSSSVSLARRQFSFSSNVLLAKKSTGKKNTTSAGDGTVCQLFDQSDLLVGRMTVREAEELAKKENMKLLDMGVNADSLLCLKLITGQAMAAESKRQRLERKSEKLKQVKEKEFRIVSNIDQHDLSTKLRQARDTVSRGGRAKFVIRAHRKSTEADKEIVRVSKEIRSNMADCAQFKEAHKTPTELMLLLTPTAEE